TLRPDCRQLVPRLPQGGEVVLVIDGVRAHPTASGIHGQGPSPRRRPDESGPVIQPGTRSRHAPIRSRRPKTFARRISTGSFETGNRGISNGSVVRDTPR